MSSPTSTDHQQELITKSISYAAETMTHNSEHLPSSSSSSSDSDTTYDIQQVTSPTSPFQEVEQEQEPHSDIGKTTTQDSNLPTSSYDANVHKILTLPFQQQQEKQQLMETVQSAYSPKHDAYVMPALPALLEGFPPIPQLTFSKSAMERMFANVVLPPSPSFSKLKPVLLQQLDSNMVQANSPTIITRPSSSSSLKIHSDFDNIKNPPLPPITYLRQRSRPPKASSDDTNFKIPDEPSSRRALDNNEAGPSSGDGDDSGDNMLKEFLDSPCSKQQFISAAGGSIATPNNGDNECSTSDDMDENES